MKLKFPSALALAAALFGLPLFSFAQNPYQNLQVSNTLSANSDCTTLGATLGQTTIVASVTGGSSMTMTPSVAITSAGPWTTTQFLKIDTQAISSTIVSTGASQNGEYVILNTAGSTYVRVCASSVSSGTAAVVLNASYGVPIFNAASGALAPSPSQASFTDRGGSITLGGTSQTAVTANTSRRRLVVQNACTATGEGIAAAESIFINFTSAASATAGTSIELVPCGSYDSGAGPVTTELVTIVSATTSHKYIAKEQ